MQTKFMKPESLWDSQTWAAYNETLLYCLKNKRELRDYGEYFEVYSPTLEDKKATKCAEIAAKRYAKEIAGVDINGVSVATDRDSQALITGAALAAMIDSDYSLNWKTENGFIHLTASEIVAVAQAVRAHVQSCFDREGELVALVDAAQTAEDLNAIEITFE